MSSCPRCPHLVLTPGHGVIDEDVCGGCGGRFLSGQVSDRVVVFELGIERDVLREIASWFSGPRLPCPGCQGLMRSLRLRGVPVDLCLSCGGLWLDAGELVALSGGRHLEIGASLLAAAAEPAVLGQMPPLVKKLGRGQSVVLLHQLEAPDEAALVRAFSHTDGLTRLDAQLLADHCQGLVAEGLSLDGAINLQAVLADEHIDCSVVDSGVLRLPPALQCHDIDIDARGIVARLHTGSPFFIPWVEVDAVAGGMVKRERLEPRRDQEPPPFFGMTAFARPYRSPHMSVENELVRSDEVVVDVLRGGATPQRLRVLASPRAAQIDCQQRLWDAAISAQVPRGRAASTPEWPRYRRLREIEREAAWVRWRAGRWLPS